MHPPCRNCPYRDDVIEAQLGIGGSLFEATDLIRRLQLVMHTASRKHTTLAAVVRALPADESDAGA